MGPIDRVAGYTSIRMSVAAQSDVFLVQDSGEKVNEGRSNMETQHANMKTEDTLATDKDVRENTTQRVWYLDQETKTEFMELMSISQVSFPLEETVMPTTPTHIRRAKVATPAVLSDRGMWVSKEWCERVWDPLNSRMSDQQYVRVLTNGSNDAKCPFGVVIIVEGHDPMTIDVADELIETMKRQHNDVIEHCPKGWDSGPVGQTADWKSGSTVYRSTLVVKSRNQYHRMLHGGLRAGQISPGPISLRHLSLAIMENCTTVQAVYRDSIRVATLLEAVRKAIFSQIYALTRPVSEALLSAASLNNHWVVSSLEKTESGTVATALTSRGVVTIPHDFIRQSVDGTHYYACLPTIRVGSQALPRVDVRGFMLGSYDGLRTAVACRDDRVRKYPFIAHDQKVSGTVLRSENLQKITRLGRREGDDHVSMDMQELETCVTGVDEPDLLDYKLPTVEEAIKETESFVTSIRRSEWAMNMETEVFLEGNHLFLTLMDGMKPLVSTTALLRESDDDGQYPRIGSLAMSKFLISNEKHKGGVHMQFHNFTDAQAQEGRRKSGILLVAANLSSEREDRELFAMNSRLDNFLSDRIFFRQRDICSYRVSSLIDDMRAGIRFYVDSSSDLVFEENKDDRVRDLNGNFWEWKQTEQDRDVHGEYPEHCSCGARIVLTREDGYECATGCDTLRLDWVAESGETEGEEE